MIRPTFAEIRLDFLKENLNILKGLHGEKNFFCPMIKANAYGHGDVEIAKTLALNGVRQFGVALVEEGIRLREAGLREEILVFGYFDKKSMAEAFQQHLTPVISTFEALYLLQKNQVSKVHLKFDTGMSRLGFQYNDLSKITNFLQDQKGVKVEGICTHFSQSHDSFLEDGVTHHQMKYFVKIEKELKNYFQYSHSLNSDAILNGYSGTEAYHQDKNYLGARPGIALYGYPRLNGQGKKTNLKPIMSLKASIASLKKIKKGESVSYNGTWKSLRESLIAVVTIGYGDGYQRGLSNQAWMLYQGQRCPVIGQICMDYCMLDLTDLRHLNPKVGDHVTVWGYGEAGESELLSAEDLARQVNTISYELLTDVSLRIPRIYLNGGTSVKNK